MKKHTDIPYLTKPRPKYKATSNKHELIIMQWKAKCKYYTSKVSTQNRRSTPEKNTHIFSPGQRLQLQTLHLQHHRRPQLNHNQYEVDNFEVN